MPKNKKMEEIVNETNKTKKKKNEKKLNNNNNNNSNNNNINNNNKKKKKKSTKYFKTCVSCVKGLSYIFFTVIFFTHGILPLAFWMLPEISNFAIFSNRITWPMFANLSDIHYYGLEHTRSFFLKPKRNIQLGVWHILPKNVQTAGKDFDDDQFQESLQNTNTPVVLYMHGNSGTRGCGHRVQLYKRLSEMNYHIVTLDYRGFGDSTGIPFEDGVVEDSLFVYKWIKSNVPQNTPILLWGHSLGSGIATRLAKTLSDNGDPPAALFLESPFNNILEVSANLPPFVLYRPFQLLSYMILNSVERCGTEFASDQNIKDVTSPVLILHAEDDSFVPLKLAVKLYEAGLKSRPKTSGQLKLLTFEASHGYGHKHLHRAPHLPSIIKSFLASSSGEHFEE